MFYGAVLKPGVEVSPSSEHGEILHLSQACLHNPTSNEKTYLQICQGDQSYSLCVLQKDKNENASLDLFVSAREGTRFKISGGKNEVHLVGYFEPDAGSDDDACFHSEDDDEEDSDAEGTQSAASDEEMAKENDKDDSEVDSDAENEDGEEDSDDEEDDEEDSEEDGEDDDDDEDDDEDDDDDDEDEEDNDDDEASSEEAAATPAKPLLKKQKGLEKAAAAPKGKDAPSAAATDNKKRKAETPAAKPQKLQKAADGSKVKSGPETEFEKAISDYLKKNGRCMISVLAGKVRKPEALKAVKYQAFLKSKPQFVIDGQYISLKA